ncbi:S8 family peptidase [Kineococcus indalonis]|uniref:S8 family peptidase n=1 Tax=Kineococcus indalonis TaxID=2696566 RepID=UPI001412EB2A|nr:S8/S53 family peptidase [Kineococcus indalonis]NAZ85031.1 S8 family serine peptidase [Kineococcus indalonis]
MTRHMDPRSSEQRREDGARVALQLRRMADAESSRSYQRDLLAAIVQRRTASSPPGGPPGGAAVARYRPCEVGCLEQDTGFLVAVLGEVLVRTSAAARAAKVLRPLGYAGEEVEELRGLVTRFSRPGTPVHLASRHARELRAAGVPASVNHVVPLGYVAKGEGGFEPASAPPGPRGPGTSLPQGAVRVAVVDTGRAAEERRDGWLRNAEGDVDPLYRNPGREPGELDLAAGHGQFTAGVVQQVARGAALRSYDAVDSDGIGSDVRVAAAVLRAADAGAQLVNLSLGTRTVDDVPPVGMQVALEVLAEEHPDVLLVAAAGNSGGTRPTWPAAFRSVVAVASVTASLKPSPWSDHGPWVDCSAIGEGVVSTYVPGTESRAVDKEDPDTFGPDSWALGTGTSFAAPQITGAVADRMAREPGTAPRRALLEVLRGDRRARDVPGYGTAVPVLPGTAAR